MNDSEEDNLKTYKTIILGNTLVGKTSILIRYLDNMFQTTKTTIGIDYRFKKITHQGV